jgi:hypothetical protein
VRGPRRLVRHFDPDLRPPRPAGVSRAEASAAKNRELVELERRAAQIERAEDAATEAERARVQALQAD